MAERSTSTDPNWDAANGGLPHVVNLCDCIECARKRAAWHLSPSPRPETESTVTAPPREPTQHERLLAFARAALGGSWNRDTADLQELGIKYGLLIEAKFDPAVHGEHEAADFCEPGDPWFVFVDWLKAPVTIMPDQPPFAERLSPFARMKLDAAVKALEEAIAEIRRPAP